MLLVQINNADIDLHNFLRSLQPKSMQVAEMTFQGHSRSPQSRS